MRGNHHQSVKEIGFRSQLESICEPLFSALGISVDWNYVVFDKLTSSFEPIQVVALIIYLPTINSTCATYRYSGRLGTLTN